MAVKTYNGIRTSFDCKVDEDLHGGPYGTILVAYYECHSIAETVATALDLFDDFNEVCPLSRFAGQKNNRYNGKERGNKKWK